MTATPRWQPTAHAERVIVERAIADAWIDRVLASPESTEPDPDDPSLVHSLARIAERENRMLRVVHDPSTDPQRVITVFFDRRRR